MVRILLVFFTIMVVGSAIYVSLMVAIAAVILWGLITAPLETLGILAFMAFLTFAGSHPLLALTVIAFGAYLAYKGSKIKSEAEEPGAPQLPLPIDSSSEWEERTPGVRTRWISSGE